MHAPGGASRRTRTRAHVHSHGMKNKWVRRRERERERKRKREEQADRSGSVGRPTLCHTLPGAVHTIPK